MRANYKGTSGGTEVAAAVKIFKTSETETGILYTQFLGGRDSRAYNCVVELKLYGDHKMSKVDCAGHVQRTMGSRL